MSARLSRAIVASAVCASGISAPAASPTARPANACLAHVPEAAARSSLPPNIIVRVMMAESGGNPRALSAKGAMGCMQIMPATWASLSARYSLGRDPWDARANMSAGSLYLAELAQRHGFPGAFAAYNAGEARWLRYRDSGASLPAETVAYMARLGADTPVMPGEAQPRRWQEARLFMARGGDRPMPVTDDRDPDLRASASTEESDVQSLPSLFPLARPHVTKRE
jgi:soluble lytic murein transglycosylase-like protein